MLLQRLKEYAERELDLPPTLYSSAPVRYLIDLDREGQLLNRQPVDTADPSNRATRRGQRRLVPQIQRASGIKPLLFADNAEYTLGLARDPAKAAQVAARHVSYMELVSRCLVETGDPDVLSVHTFLSNDPTAQLRLPDDFDRGETVSFTVDGRFVPDRPAVQDFWAAEHDPARAAGTARVMQCVVCGEEKPVLDRLQAKLKGVPGGQTSGTALISANAKAFESYGLEASLIAPTCATCGERFTQGANALLAGERTRFYLGGAAFVFWTREPVEDDFFGLMTNPDPADVHRLLASLHRGGSLPAADDTAFYAAVLSGSGGRAVVRDWIDTTVGEVRTHLATWFRRQRIVGPFGEESQPLGLYALALGTVRESGDLAPPVPRALVRAALTGTPLPPNLLYQAVRRNRAEQKVTRQRAALIKLAWTTQNQERERPDKEDVMVQLDPNHPSEAYQCGRLLSVLEEIQRLAIPGAGTTIVDRFYGTASTAPAAVFSRLVRGAQPHLAKLERDRRGAWMALQSRLEDIMGQIGAFPRTLALEDQGLFALGYYHQRAFDRAQAREGAERRRAAEAVASA
jgi:CRISPR-associated protein Csd1